MPAHLLQSLRNAARVAAIAWLPALPVLPTSAAPLPVDHVYFHTDFEATNAVQAFPGATAIEAGYRSQRALAIESKPGAGSATVSLTLPVTQMRGYLVRGTAMVRADDVSAKPAPWNGIKLMLPIETPDRKLWPQAPVESGTFDWRRVAFTARVPADATAVRLVLGLEQVSGKVWFDDLKISVAKPPAVRVAKPASGPRYTGHREPRLRGTMISPNIDAAGLRTLGSDWNANLIRWQLIRTGPAARAGSGDDYDQWLEGELKKLDAALPTCEQVGLRVVLDLHSPPGGKVTAGGYGGSDDRLFTDPACQQQFVEIWRRMALRYKDAKPIWGYDLANEPVEDLIETGCEDWQGLAERAARAIREIDPQRTIIVEPAAWGGPDGLKDLVPLPISNVVYSVHMYLPHAFTHQGVHGAGPAYRYPGVIEGKSWDKAQLEAALRPVVEFQQTYGVHIYIGEFSAIRWAPEDSATRYLSDLIEIFEAHGWDWSYHAFREWNGWSVEHGPDRNDPQRAAQPTDRERLLRHWFAKNQKPGW
jgi:hypothetical protein